MPWDAYSYLHRYSDPISEFIKAGTDFCDQILAVLRPRHSYSYWRLVPCFRHGRKIASLLTNARIFSLLHAMQTAFR
jgi:hypothetical protein